MKNVFKPSLVIYLIVVLLSFWVIGRSVARPLAEKFEVGTVAEILNQESIPVDGMEYFTQRLLVSKSDGESVEVELGTTFQPLTASQVLNPGKQVVLTQGESGEWIIVELFRLPILLLLAVVFVTVVILVAAVHGLKSLVALCASLAVVIGWLVPSLLSGSSPLVLAILGCVVIGAISLYLGHGWSWKSHLSVVAIAVTLTTVSLLASAVIGIGQLVGLGSHESYILQYGPTQGINLQGLLLAGIMLGTLGILDDIVISQISIVFQLKAAQPKISFNDLFRRALSVGRDHIAALTNTLILAYTGSNLPLFLLILAQDRWPWWVTLSNEAVAEEIVRTLLGSLGLVLAVPLATFLACFVLEQPKLKQLLTSELA